MPLRNMDTADASEALSGLIQKLSLAEHSPKIIAFIAARPGEGTSTIVWDYAVALAAQTHRKILIVDCGEDASPHVSATSPGIVEVLIASQPLSAAIHPAKAGVSICRWMKNVKNRSESAKILHTHAVWENLAQSFDTILIDAPSLQSSFDGVVLASKATATVIIIEAEATPEPVTINLRDTLIAAGAEIAGVVMNKRRYHIPHKIYNRL